ncbi:hypothetical protein K491DRAFT_718468 [Lophiostoma macrostomum CBS 122681]|uniref:Uncharacterized protein n=1 Tax=Lophiostoma macrostomum CBS 122681 TaxID=1314788 RepID=A0A6A6SZN1_9PLEO|nr:hypothetical protein K491DRAFT_718468 [Lophiostoma macrostomum CBS 122681]
MAFMPATTSSRGKQKMTTSNKGSATTSPESASPSLRSFARTPISATSSSALRTAPAAPSETLRPREAQVTDPDFAASVLDPHGITFLPTGLGVSIVDHLGLKHLGQAAAERYKAYSSIFPLEETWIGPIQPLERVQEEYAAMRHLGLDEAEFQAFARKEIFRSEPRNVLAKVEQRLSPVRLLKHTRKILDERQWLMPPLQQSDILAKTYEWIVEPDCAYHVSDQCFQDGYRNKLGRQTAVTKRGICPYLTVQFEKDREVSAGTARNQIAVHGSLALYNRWLLKKIALDTNAAKCMKEAHGKRLPTDKSDEAEWSEEAKKHIRHYAIIFQASNWELFCLTPKSYERWTGCEIASLTNNCCESVKGVEKLIQAVNDVHFWGLSTHAASCKADITLQVASPPNADTSDLSIVD